MSFASFGPVSFPHDPDTKKTALTIHGPPGHTWFFRLDSQILCLWFLINPE